MRTSFGYYYGRPIGFRWALPISFVPAILIVAGVVWWFS